MQSQIKKVQAVLAMIVFIGQIAAASAQQTTPSQNEKSPWDKIRPMARKLLKYDEITQWSEELAGVYNESIG